MENDRYSCPCCGYLTYSEKPPGSFDICPVCYWEDDNVQNDDPTFSGGANDVSLVEAKNNFQRFGAIKKRYVSKVRKPLPSEKPK